jgi:hypothetical protein
MSNKEAIGSHLLGLGAGDSFRLQANAVVMSLTLPFACFNLR